MIKMYSYDPETKEFTGETIRQIGVTSGPANSTELKAPASIGADEAAVFQDDDWVLIKDFRGSSYWTPEGEHVTITQLGVEIPENALFEKPDLRTLDEKNLMRSSH